MSSTDDNTTADDTTQASVDGVVDETLAELAAQTAKIPWRELQRFFAAGQTIAVAADVDLVATARRVMDDDADTLRALIDSGRVAAVSDEQARAWIADDASVWAVVVKPWVLVQAVTDN